MPNTKYLYRDIFTLSKEIELLIQLESFEKVDKLLDKRRILIDQILPEDILIGEIKEIVDKIKILDAKNISQMRDSKSVLGKNISSLSRNIKCVSMYKVKDTFLPSFYNEKD